MNRLTLLICPLLLILLLPACQEQEPIRIGYVGGLTGRASGLGTSGRNGFQLAIDHANAAGGIGGRAIIGLTRDNRMSPDMAGQVTRELLEEGVAGIIGPMTSQMAVHSVAEVNIAAVPMISPTVSTNQLSGLDDYFFRVYYTNAQAAELMAQRLVRDLGISRIALVYDLSNRAYTEDWVTTFREHYEDAEGEVVSTIPFELKEDTLFSQIVAEALEVRPEGLLLLANAIDTALLCQQVVKHDNPPPMFATGWSYSDDLLQFGGRAVEGLTVIQSTNVESNQQTYLTFKEAYRQRFNEEPNFPAVHAYDATQTLLAALAEHPGTTELKQQLLTTNRSGLQNRIQFDRYGDLQYPEIYLAHVVDSQFRMIPGE